MKRISILGGGLIASKFIEELLKSKYKIDFFLPSSKFKEFNKIALETCKNKNVKITNSLKKLEVSDLIISAGNHKIIEENFIQSNSIINFHGAPLPGYGGSAGPSFALINDEKYFGCTFQIMSKELDSGPILKEYNFEINNEMNAYDLDQKSIDCGTDNLIITLDTFFMKNYQYKVIDFNSLVINKRSLLEKYMYIPYEDLNSKKSLQVIRALTWPGVLKPAYTLINKQKIQLIFNGIKA